VEEAKNLNQKDRFLTILKKNQMILTTHIGQFIFFFSNSGLYIFSLGGNGGNDYKPSSSLNSLSGMAGGFFVFRI